MEGSLQGGHPPIVSPMAEGMRREAVGIMPHHGRRGGERGPTNGRRIDGQGGFAREDRAGDGSFERTGADFARGLAARGCTVLLAARREDRLKVLQAELQKKYGVSVEVFPADLSDPAAPQQLLNSIRAAGFSVDVLVNNAGLGLFGDFLAVPWEKTEAMLRLDILALTRMTWLFGAEMAARGSGYILQVASTGAFQPTPTYAAYCAAKSYVLSLGEALHYEFKPKGVVCTTLCPGVTRTEFFQVAGQRMTPFQRMTIMDSPAVARIGLDALERGRASVVAGWMNALVAFSTRFLPRAFLVAMAAGVMAEPA